jgi:hypothetical protein
VRLVAYVLLLGFLSVSAAADDKDGLPPSAVAVAVPQPASAPIIVSNVTSMPALPGSTAAEPPAAPVVVVKPEAKHRFFDVRNSAGLAALAVGLTGDALSTQKGLGRPGFHEMNPVARPFVQSRVGAAFYSAGSFALLGSGMYLAHKTNHHKVERIMPFALAAWEGLLTYRNYHLISSSTRTH